mgnify:CR=1 FL=1|tara:strand:+ start:1488 stop:2621 length:1134 start_codon:yes stop_codon:yes gene_type:complete
MEKVYIFGDEFGTSTLKNNDVKNITHFIYSAIVIKESNIHKALKVREDLSNLFFKGQILKSSSRVLRNEETRLKVLDYLIKHLKFVVYVMVIDKEKLDNEKGGLRFKEVFYKYFQKIFISQIDNNFTDFEIHMDNLINEKYQIELKNYIAQNYQNNFFEKYNISDDREEPLLQLADILAGSYGRVFNASFISDKSEDIFNILKPITGNIAFFPFKKDNKVFITNNEDKIDEELFSIVRKDAIEIYENESDLIKKKVIEYLLWYQKVMPFRYTQTYEIINAIKHNTGKEVSIDNLRNIIKELRFKGIIVVSSSSRSGYKLAVNKSDVHTYFKHYLNYILPMLKKIEIANSVFLNKTVGEFIPLQEIDDLKKLVETLGK